MVDYKTLEAIVIKQGEEIKKLNENLASARRVIDKLNNYSSEQLNPLINEFMVLKEHSTDRNTIEFALLDSKIISGTTHASAGTQSTHAHGMSRTPKIVLLIPTSNGVIYRSATTDATNIYVKGSANSLTFDAWCIA